MTEEFLKHHGILGMHWGKRKASTTSFTAKGSVNEKEREISFKNVYANRDKMSTRALKSKVDRLQTEQRLKELTEKPEADRQKAALAKSAAKSKRTAKIIKAALSVIGSLPLESYVKEGKTMEEVAKSKAAKSAIKRAQGYAVALSKGADAFTQSAIDRNSEEILQHHGIKGMHWRDRRAIVKAGGKAELKSLLKENKVNELINKSEANASKSVRKATKAAKKNYKNAKLMYKAVKSKENKLTLKVAKYNKKAVKLNRKSIIARANAQKLVYNKNKTDIQKRAQSLISKYGESKVKGAA